MSAAHTVPAMEPALFNPQTGRLDAARIAHEFNVPVAMIAEAIGRKAPGVRKSPDASSLQGELRRLYRIWVALVDLYAATRPTPESSLMPRTGALRTMPPSSSSRTGIFAPWELFVDAMSARQPV